MQKNGLGHREIIIETTIGNDVAQHKCIAEEYTYQTKCTRQNAEGDIHVIYTPAAHIFEAVEENDPDREVDEIICHHSDHLRKKRNTIFHRRLQIGFPDGKEEFYGIHIIRRSRLAA